MKFNLELKVWCSSDTEEECPDGSLVYCDIPYKGTTEYSTVRKHSCMKNFILGAKI